MVCPSGKEILSGYRTKIFRPECNPNFQSVHCIADLDSDIREVLPYLNAVLGGSTYIEEPPSVTFKFHGKLLTVHARQIAVNGLRDEEEAGKVLRWLAHEINHTWENRTRIKPSFGAAPRPQALEILKLLPRNNCRRCRQETCTVFSLLVADGAKGPEDCPGLGGAARTNLQKYLAQFGPGA